LPRYCGHRHDDRPLLGRRRVGPWGVWCGRRRKGRAVPLCQASARHRTGSWPAQPGPRSTDAV